RAAADEMRRRLRRGRAALAWGDAPSPPGALAPHAPVELKRACRSSALVVEAGRVAGRGRRAQALAALVVIADAAIAERDGRADAPPVGSVEWGLLRLRRRGGEQQRDDDADLHGRLSASATTLSAATDGCDTSSNALRASASVCSAMNRE